MSDEDDDETDERRLELHGKPDKARADIEIAGGLGPEIFRQPADGRRQPDDSAEKAEQRQEGNERADQPPRR